ncbi:hypothetical protein HDU86_008051 [Geranomyces michiganensis]|nr:hypothetical protein HDU86_008051 [Geranomyces michiganensis]
MFANNAESIPTEERIPTEAKPGTGRLRLRNIRFIDFKDHKANSPQGVSELYDEVEEAAVAVPVRAHAFKVNEMLRLIVKALLRQKGVDAGFFNLHADISVTGMMEECVCLKIASQSKTSATTLGIAGKRLLAGVRAYVL